MSALLVTLIWMLILSVGLLPMFFVWHFIFKARHPPDLERQHHPHKERRHQVCTELLRVGTLLIA